MDRKDIMFALFDYGADIEFCLKTHNQMGSHLKNVVIATHQSWIASKAESLNVTPAKRQSKSL